MKERTSDKPEFIGYEYRDITVAKEMEGIYADSYESFGWELENSAPLQIGINKTIMKFKRDRKIRNKAELTRLQRQFDACIGEISSMEKSKVASASIVAYTIGLLGTAFLAGATFSYLGGLIVLCIVLAVPGFIGWVLPYFAYNSTVIKKSATLSPLIESKYDEVYEVCEKASTLL